LAAGHRDGGPALGFGAMRLPMQRRGGTEHVRVRAAVRLMRHAFDCGINYVDTAWPECYNCRILHA